MKTAETLRALADGVDLRKGGGGPSTKPAKLTTEELRALVVATIDRECREALHVLGTVPWGRGRAHYVPDHLRGLTTEEQAQDAIATHLINDALTSGHWSPDKLRAFRGLGDERSGGKGWLQEVPGLVAERWTAVKGKHAAGGGTSPTLGAPGTMVG